MSFFKWFRKHRVLGVTMLACLCFLALALFGWGVSWRDLFRYFWVSLVLLVVVVSAAALTGWLIYRVRRWLGRAERD